MIYNPLNLAIAETEIVKVILTASLTLTSMLIAIIGVLLAQYTTVRTAPSYISNPYRYLIIGMVFVLGMGVTTSFLALCYLLGQMELFSTILIFFTILIFTIVVAVIAAVIIIFNKRLNTK